MIGRSLDVVATQKSHWMFGTIVGNVQGDAVVRSICIRMEDVFCGNTVGWVEVRMVLLPQADIHSTASRALAFASSSGGSTPCQHMRLSGTAQRHRPVA